MGPYGSGVNFKMLAICVQLISLQTVASSDNSTDIQNAQEVPNLSSIHDVTSLLINIISNPITKLFMDIFQSPSFMFFLKNVWSCISTKLQELFYSFIPKSILPLIISVASFLDRLVTVENKEIAVPENYAVDLPLDLISPIYSTVNPINEIQIANIDDPNVFASREKRELKHIKLNKAKKTKSRLKNKKIISKTKEIKQNVLEENLFGSLPKEAKRKTGRLFNSYLKTHTSNGKRRPKRSISKVDTGIFKRPFAYPSVLLAKARLKLERMKYPRKCTPDDGNPSKNLPRRQKL